MYRAYRLLDYLTEQHPQYPNDDYPEDMMPAPYYVLTEKLTYYNYCYYRKPDVEYPRNFPGVPLGAMLRNRWSHERVLYYICAMASEAIALFDKAAATAGCDKAMAERMAYECRNYLTLAEDGLALMKIYDLIQSGEQKKIAYVYQQQLNGLGDAVLQAKPFCGNDPFAVLLGDTVMDSNTDRCVTHQLVDVYDRFGSSVVALEEVPLEKVSSYGIASGKLCGNVMDIDKMVEKPAPENAPSRLAFAARYIFTPGIFDELSKTPRGKDNELQLTDAMATLARSEGVMAYEFDDTLVEISCKYNFDTLKAIDDSLRFDL